MRRHNSAKVLILLPDPCFTTKNCRMSINLRFGGHTLPHIPLVSTEKHPNGRRGRVAGSILWASFTPLCPPLKTLAACERDTSPYPSCRPGGVCPLIVKFTANARRLVNLSVQFWKTAAKTVMLWGYCKDNIHLRLLGTWISIQFSRGRGSR